MGEGISAEKAYEIHQLFHGVRCPDAPDPARLVSYMEDGKMKYRVVRTNKDKGVRHEHSSLQAQD